MIPHSDRPGAGLLADLKVTRYSALELFSGSSEVESLVSLLLGGKAKAVPQEAMIQFNRFREQVERTDTSDVKVVVLGGGTGLATIIGGDSRREDWPDHPFSGLKQFFTDLHSVVCVTDDGGSTGELRKVLPLVGLGDLRHVLLATIRRDALIRRYNLDEAQVWRLVRALHRLFNYRFSQPPPSSDALMAAALAGLRSRERPLPTSLHRFLSGLADSLFSDPRLRQTLHFSQCLGNLFLAAAVYRHLDPGIPAAELLTLPEEVRRATAAGLADLSRELGVPEDGVLPASLTPAELALLYSNGVLSTSEEKSARVRRSYPVDQVTTLFCGEATLHPRLHDLLTEATVILFAPGSLYTSIIPILQTPGVAEAIRANHRALKLLVANIWVQTGETDATREAPERKFYVSDLIAAYQRNIPDGVTGLFSHVIALSMADIPGSVLQGYALESKEPIVVDRERVQAMGFGLIEAAVFSSDLLQRQRRIQHDPDALARTVKTLWFLHFQGALSSLSSPRQKLPPEGRSLRRLTQRLMPCCRYEQMRSCLESWGFGRVDTVEQVMAERTSPLGARQRQELIQRLLDILWHHPDIPLAHLAAPQKLCLVDANVWAGTQEWDNIISSYQPVKRRIVIRDDMAKTRQGLESAFLQALGQSLLGNYAAQKSIEPLLSYGNPVGLLFRLQLIEAAQLKSFFSLAEIGSYLQLNRMRPCVREQGVFTRAVNLYEGFTPPGLYFGLFYAWYLDNALAPTMEYKMAIMRSVQTAMIAEQKRISQRRKDTIRFFREKVFRQGALSAAP